MRRLFIIEFRMHPVESNKHPEGLETSTLEKTKLYAEYNKIFRIFFLINRFRLHDFRQF